MSRLTTGLHLGKGKAVGRGYLQSIMLYIWLKPYLGLCNSRLNTLFTRILDEVEEEKKRTATHLGWGLLSNVRINYDLFQIFSTPPFLPTLVPDRFNFSFFVLPTKSTATIILDLDLRRATQTLGQSYTNYFIIRKRMLHEFTNNFNYI